MKRIFALVLSLTALIATPGLATADPTPAMRKQAIDYVIQRALSQRGVPFSYGGGDASGPTLGVERDAPATTGLAAASPNPLLPSAVSPAGVPQLGPGALPDLRSGPAPAPAPAPRVVGFDASGLVVYAFAGVGIKLPRSSGEQYKVGRKVLPSQALPGDLLFYGPEGTQSVALFVGNGQMVETTDAGVALSAVRTNGMAPYLSRIIDS